MPALLSWRTVMGNAAYGLEPQGVARDRSRQTERGYLGMAGLLEFAESYAWELSGDVQQSANLARAQAIEPWALLCDEPLATLDAQTWE